MMSRAQRLLAAAVLVLVSSSLGYAQGGGQSLSGTVVDSGGGVIPGAAVVVKNVATGESFEVTSNESGVFSIPAISVGSYVVTVTLQGFKTAVVNDVRVVTGTTASVRAVLEIGALSETVQVSSRAELVQSQSPQVSSTLVAEQLSEIPLSSRNALYAVTMLPGVQYGSGGGPRAAGINGLPNNTVNITIDGIQTGNMLQSTDGFFSMVTPRLDAVEEITITGAVPGSGSGPGSVQIAFATRSGSNRLEGSGYHYWRQPQFNANYYFNKVNGLPRNEVIVHQYGFRQGGPIVIPGLYDGRNKSFFFFNFEHLHQPSSATRTRQLLRPEAQAGIFGYNVTVGGVQTRRTVDILALAAANGQITARDPVVMRMIDKIRAGTATTGTINDVNTGNTLDYVFQADRHRQPVLADHQARLQPRRQPSPERVLLVAAIHEHYRPAEQRRSAIPWPAELRHAELLSHHRQLDAAFDARRQPGQRAARRLAVVAERLLLEHHVGPLHRSGRLRARVPDQHRSPTYNTNPAPRNTTTWSVDNTLNWLRGAHSFSMGGGYAGVFNRTNSYNVVPSITLGFNTNTDPAAGMFNTTNFPSASAGNLDEARALYALLTGRVSAIPGTARLDSATGEYVYNGDLARKSRQSSFSAFVLRPVARHAGADPQRRHPLGSAHAVHAGRRAPGRWRRLRTSAASPASATVPADGPATSSIRTCSPAS